MILIRRKRILSLAIAALWCLQANAEEHFDDHCNGADEEYIPAHHGWYWTWENDLLGPVKSDNYYTQGGQAGYNYKNSDLPMTVRRANSWICKALRFAPAGDGRAKALSSSTVFLGQQLFTPRDTTRVDPIADDRPYAGWAYGGARLDLVQALELSPRAHRRWRTHSIELQLGVVGSKAVGKSTQRNFHNDTGLAVQGWDNQITNRFGAQMFYNYSTRLGSIPIGGLIGDLLFNSSTALGNLQVYSEVGGTVRLGRNMGPISQRAIVPSIANMSMQPHDVDASSGVSAETNERRRRIRESQDTQKCKYLGAEECYLFFSLVGRAVAKNIFLEPAPSGAGSGIRTEPLLYDMSLGARLRYKRWRVDYITTTRSREFSPAPGNPFDREGRHDFGSLTLSCYGSFGDYNGKWQFACPTFVGMVAAVVASR